MAKGILELSELLDEYSKDVARATNNAMDKTAKEAVAKLKNTSPKKSGDYARSWGLKRERSKGHINTITVHNRDHYQLTHLLENGHVIRNAKGVYGRAPAHPHIKPVEEWAKTAFVQEVEKELK